MKKKKNWRISVRQTIVYDKPLKQASKYVCLKSPYNFLNE